MASDTEAEKRHAPTERRLREAREKGQIRRSNDLPKAAITLLVILAVTVLGGALGGLTQVWLAEMIRGVGQPLGTSIVSIVEFGAVFIGFLCAVLLLALIAGSVSGGWIVALGLILPKIERVDPAKAWGQIFSTSNLIEVLKSIAKILVIGGAAWLAYRVEYPSLLSLSAPHRLTIGSLGGPAVLVIAAACAGAVVLAGADVAVQIWLNRRSLRLTDQEMRDEIKNAEGDPHMRGRRRAEMRKLTRGRLRREMKTASVVVTNPTHYAVALRYRRNLDPVPFLIAKGAGLNANMIVDEARLSGVPLVEAPPLARALYRFVEVDQPIPHELFKAVAEILIYVWRLEGWRTAGGERPVRPVFPASLEDIPRQRGL